MTVETESTDPQHTKLARAIQALQKTRQKLAAVEAAQHAPIAIIGMGCHYPGEADTPARFWQNLCNGLDAIGELPAARAADLAIQNSLSGGFLSEVAHFDAPFFGLAPREVVVMDPAHRLLLETTWAALEAANLVPAALFNTEMGVFIGSGMSGYLKYCIDQSSDLYTATGNAASTAAGRISYLLGITGPCVAVDTACSASLVAIHLACQSLRNGECNTALAGGVNLLLDTDWTTMFVNGNMLSADARCKTFDAAANGYVRGEGCGIIVLKRLADAVADGDTIVAVIRGTAINQDGPSGGLTVPNGPAQERVIRRALADAQLQPAQIAYIEAHGTGTPLGDPIEIGAISNVFQGRDTPLYVGSAKTNIGHLEMAAGVAGLMKLALSLQHGLIPPHLHLHTPNPFIDWDTSPVQVPTATTPWPKPADGAARIGGVSSFGFSGTNAHVIVAEAPDFATVSNAVERPIHLLTIAAKSDAALRAYAQRYHDWLVDQPSLDVADLCYTSHVGRSHYEHRMSLAVPSATALQRALAAYLVHQESAGRCQGVVPPRQTAPKIAFLFTGQGAQYVGMGCELYATSPTFRATLDRCEELFQQETGKSLLAILYPAQRAEERREKTEDDESAPAEPSSLDDTTYTQPALFALAYALATLWQSWGIQPDMLLGHSIGEVAAACVAGVFSLEDGLKLVTARGRLMGALPQDGAMVSLMADSASSSFEVRVRQAIAPYAKEVSIAAVNGPGSIVITGQRAKVLALADQFAAAGVKTRKLTVSHAFHSPLMEPMLADFRRVAQRITYHQPKRRLVSNVTGQVAGADITTPEYWVRHVREAVRFGDGVQTLREQGCMVFLEIGPKPTLLGMAEQGAGKQAPITLLPSLREGQSDWQQLLESLGAMYVQGVAIDWPGCDRDYQRRKILLPTYPFQRQRYWVESNAGNTTGAADQAGFAQWLANNNIEQLTDLVTEKGRFATDERATITRVLTTLNAESRAQQLTAQVAAMLYDVAWERLPSLPLTPPATPGHWLLVADAQGVGNALAGQLRALGEIVATVTTPAELAVALAHGTTTTAVGDLPWRGVVYLWGLQATIPVDSAALLEEQATLVGNLLSVVQALAAQPQSPTRLWVVTQGAQPLAPLAAVTVAQTPLWGLGRVIGLEHRALWGGLIDVEPLAAPETAAHLLLTELLQPHPDDETQVAYRNGARHGARLAPGKLNAQGQVPPIHADAAYLVTGGLGALGLLVAQWLTTQGARRLILTGRRGITTAAQQAVIDRLTGQGVRVQIAQLDVADAAAMRHLFADLMTTATPLKGVFHTAGVLDDGILLNQSWARFANVFAAKVVGSWLLHELTRTLDLDHLVFFSSLAALLGNPGQGNYAAANAFLDGLAHYRRQQGLPALSINWGAWTGPKGLLGMAARTSQVKLASDQRITAETGMAALAQLLCQGVGGPAQLGVAPIDWRQFAGLDHPAPFLRHFVTAAEPSVAPPSLVAMLTALPTNRRLEHVRAYLQQWVGRVLGMADLPDPTAGFADLGMDSLMALELRRRLEQELQQALPTTLAFEYPTVDTLAMHLLTDVLTLAAPTSKGQESAPQRRHTGLDDPIAVLSMACRFPGADTPEAFWQLLCGGVDTVRTIPAARWQLDDYYDPQRPRPGKMYMREGAFIEQVDQFDPLFFGIAPREAIGMDPMHRLLLETSWEALERAGLAQQALIDSATGVFVGIGQGDYGAFGGGYDVTELDMHAATSGGHSIAAGRLAFTLGLQGPTMAVDTACSSSLVALHLACQSLRTGECDLALAGGVSLMLSPAGHVALSQMQALAPDGRCKTFDATADGYGRGEGGGMVLLKRLSDAQADGDPLLAVIRGSAVNHDGPSSGLTVPNKRAQEKLLRQALANANVAPDEVAYVEAHGTGTPLGDPLELRALGTVFGAERKQPLLVGSVKTNVGHLEAAAGIVGFVKTVLALHHGEIPPHLHFTQPNPYIEWDEWAIGVPTTRQPWPEPVEGHDRVAGISSFGISGTNAHVIVAAAPSGDRETGRQGGREIGERAQLLPIAAKSEPALRAYAQRYRAWLTAHPDLPLADLCYTAAVGRNHFAHRLALVAQERADLLAKLAAVAQGDEMAGIVRGTVSQPTVRVAFLFTGQGAQYRQMGRELYATEPVFRTVIDRCDGVAQTVLGRSLIDLLYPTADPQHNDLIDSHPCGQAVNFAVECALVDLWRAWGVQPDYVLGHSLGDFAAAYAAGVLSLEDGLRLVSERGRLMEQAVGSMVAVMATETAVAPFVEAYADVVIGVINGPQSVVISGGHANVAAAEAALQAAGYKTRPVAVPMAAHSPLLNSVLDEFEALVRNTITLHPPQRAVVSSMTGQLIGDELTDPTYWRRHLRNPVRFADGVTTLAAEGCTVFIEIGPKPTLLGMVGQIMAETPHLALLPALHHEQDARQTMLTALAALYVRGVAVDWATLYDAEKRRKVALPTYPFQRQRYWLDGVKKRQPQAGLRPLIDRKVELPIQQQVIFEKVVSTETLPFLADHLLYDKIAMPGACHLAFVLSCVELVTGNGQCAIDDIVFQRVLTLGAEEECVVQILFAHEKRHKTFQIISFHANNTDEPVTHASGRLIPLGEATPTVSLDLLQERCRESVAPMALYAQLQTDHITLGPTFRWFKQIWRGKDEALAQLVVPESLPPIAGYPLFPSLIDACFQLGAALWVRGNDEPSAADKGLATVPFAIDAMYVYRATNHQDLWCHIQQVDERQWNIWLLDSQGAMVAAIQGLRMREASPAAVYTRNRWQEWLYTVEWQPQRLPAASLVLAPTTSKEAHRPPQWLIFADGGGLGEALAAALQQAGATVRLVFCANSYRQLDERTFVMNPESLADYQQLFATVVRESGDRQGIVHLWSLEAPLPATATDLMQAARQSCGSTLYLVQAILREQIQPLGLWLVTENAQAINETEPMPGFGQATLWGMGRVIELEHPELNVIRVDLDGALDRPTQATLLRAELMVSAVAEPRETQIALRQNAEQTLRYVARLAAYDRQAPRLLTIDKEATYLITGGLGGIGLAVAAWLVAEGACHLLLTSRRPPNADAQARLAEWAALGVHVTYAQVDVTDATAMTQLLAQIEAAHPLRGIIHSAGVLEDKALLQQNWESFRHVLAPKLMGAWHLHTLTQGMPLDFFVLFSSAAGLLGNRGQANHAAANTFLDALAWRRHAQGLPALSINWGAWSEVGVAAHLSPHQQEQMRANGMGWIAPQSGIGALAYLLRSAAQPQAAAQVGVIPIQWATFLSGTTRQNPFYAKFAAKLAQTPPLAEETSLAASRLRLEKQLMEANAEQRRTLLLQTLGRSVAQVLRWPTSEPIDAHQELTTLGLDSLMAIELRNQVREQLPLIKLAITDFIGTSVATLTTQIAEQYNQLAALDTVMDRQAPQPEASQADPEEFDPEEFDMEEFIV